MDSNERIAELERQISVMNSRCQTDAKSYERDQYLIAKLRQQLAEKEKRQRNFAASFAMPVRL